MLYGVMQRLLCAKTSHRRSWLTTQKNKGSKSLAALLKCPLLSLPSMDLENQSSASWANMMHCREYLKKHNQLKNLYKQVQAVMAVDTICLAPGSLGAAIAIKELIQQGKLKGTIRFYGTPAEESVGGKIYMARDGLFSDVDVCLDWHPDVETTALTQSSQAMVDFIVEFKGKAAHAAADPWEWPKRGGRYGVVP